MSASIALHGVGRIVETYSKENVFMMQVLRCGGCNPLKICMAVLMASYGMGCATTPGTTDVERIDTQWHKRRFSVKPGITCLWQVNGRSNIGFDDWVRMDLEYIDKWSLKLDIRILMKTIPVVTTRSFTLRT